ncbi:LOW QUALITY PROTEIN: stabilin-2 [Genypterus blacodes]|uniref:LOW QUALITY PROTEIN: stabilin-2 n=1 Tax=Genypterus blacodes TaxID=154954 RepID=UPI003F768D34
MEGLAVVTVCSLWLLQSSAWATAEQNFCSNMTTLRTRTACHSCSISQLIPCPSTFKQSPGSNAKDCKYYIRTATLQLAIGGCSFECYKEVEERRCCPGYWGPDCMDCPEHPNTPCSSNGVCSDGLGGNGTCSCKVGFAGTACEDCEPNRFGSTCSSVCSCVHGVCNAGLHGDGRCTCFSGYKGPNCDQEMPECAALGCQQNARCMEEALTGQLVCRCLPGYQSSGSQCTSRNPCLQQVCHAHATCIHTGPDKHLCVCGEGYSGDGLVCMAVDPCQSKGGGCSPLTARCVYDGPGKAHCECLPGLDHLQKDGSCSLKDSCKPDSCHRNANCSTVGPGAVECTCHQGYLGNGKVCYGNIMQRLNDLNTEPGGQWTGQLSNAIALFGSLSWPLSNLGPFTVFVPINKGFRGTSVKTLTADASKARYLCKLHMVAGVMPFDTLKKTDIYYTLSGKSGETDTSEVDAQIKIRIHGSRKKGAIIQSDVIASNGMIHILNKLMDSVSPTVESDKQENLMKIISEYGKFDTFKSLLEKTDLASVMDMPGPYTVFAPTSSAFDVMKEGHLQYLSSLEGSSKLVGFLRNHIVPSIALEAVNAASSPRLVTMANQVLTFNVTEKGQILVNGMAVLETEVEAMNGRLYLMEGVLTPASIEPMLPHRCDLTETRTVKGDCVSCSKTKLYKCQSGVFTGVSIFGCVYRLSVSLPAVSVPAAGCSPMCNTTVTTPGCCRGFYGPDCMPCPGGFTDPCLGHGQCVDGIEGNGTCICEPNFRGSRCQYCSSPNKHGADCDQACACIHGQCDNRPDSDGRCKVDSCLLGYTGRYCERHTQACGVQPHFCHANADCDFNQGTTMCVCKPGYQGDGITCVETDPCAPPHRGGCSVNAKCIKTGPGTHSCQCLAGWREDGDECQPINNCNSAGRGGCQPNATCVYIGPGQSVCVCKIGYTGNGRDCDPVNQCVAQSRGCHYMARCRLLSGQWTCVCEEGYAGDGKVCYGTVEQELMALPQATDFLTWVTDSGLSGFLSEQNVTLLVPSADAIAQMSAEDKTFWTTKGNLPSIVRNHLIQGSYPLSVLRTVSSVTSLLKTTFPVSTTNESTVIGGATSIRPNIAATNGLIHIIDKVLVPERKLSEGLLASLTLRPEFSLFRSYLIEYNLADEIEQAEEYTVFAPTDSAVSDYIQKTSAAAMDVNTTRYHVVLSERLLKTDLQVGGYKETMLGFSYQLGVFPRDGKLFVNEAQINVSNIMSGKGVIHGLSAVLPINRNRCDGAEHEKVLGSCQDCIFPRGKICPNGTTPEKSVRKRKCMFTQMYDGERLLTIGCKASCRKTKIFRRCCSGFFGEHCEPCPGPQGQACSGNGACADGVNGTGVCQCNQCFNGTACETCQSGRYGVHCDQACLCRNGQCNDGLKGDGTCQCDVGWKGILCDEEIQSTADELCGSVKCHTSANCVIQPSGLQCLCASGFEGNGTDCSAKDPCTVDHGGCSVHAVCKRTRPGRRECVCDRGYAGDGLVCVEINPCLHGNGGCHANADCIHVGPNKTSCSCAQGYTGDGQNCKMMDMCRLKNGECHRFAKCNMTGPGVRSCTCLKDYIGDGLTCRGTVWKELLTRKLHDFYLILMMAEIPLKGRGPFTVFAPTAEAFAKEKNARIRGSQNKDRYISVVRNHIVMCHTLLPGDLGRPRNLTSLTGEVLTTSFSQGHILINQANVTYSGDVSVNGIIHEIDTILFPANMERLKEQDRPLNLTDIAALHGYKTFFKLLEDTGVMDLMNDRMNQPVTVFLPSDGAMASLPQEQKDFLYQKQNRAQLVEYLKYHIMHGQKAQASELIHLDTGKTLQGSLLSFSCGGMNNIGEIYVNGGTCRIVQRHLTFNGGVAYGIDCLLTPPSLGGRCDEQSSFSLQMTCGICGTSATRCPGSSKLKEVQKCDLPSLFVAEDSGCRSVCTFSFRQPKCCGSYFGRDCLACPGGVQSPCNNRGKCDDGHLGNGTCKCDAGFQGAACERCSYGHHGPTCKACNCTEHGSCDDGYKGTGSCFCEPGWTGERCETQQAEQLVCSPSCSPKAVCQENNTCVCRPFYEGDGFTCTVVDMCEIWNGGCAKGARCSQSGEKVSCVCPKGHSGDGFSCQPIDPCVSADNGGCHEHASCTMTGPGKKRCNCNANYVGDGVTCEVKELSINRCLQDNGLCHQDAKCTDLHFEDATLGVFHVRSDKGQYKLNYTAAQGACGHEGASVASYTQLSYAQQGGLNMCAAGWLDQARVAYPTTYANPNCGFGHVGIVDYGTRKNLSETWDAFCYRMKEVMCECKHGYIGDGYSCTGNLLQVLSSRPTLSNFLTQILNYSQNSEPGKEFVRRLTNLTVRSTLFVPDNTGLSENQTLTQRDLEYHLSEGQALALSSLKNGSRIRTRQGSLTVLGVADLLNPTALSSCYINDRFVVDSNILSSNGIIHVLQGPLKAPPPRHAMHVANKAGMGVGVLLLILLVAGVAFVGYHFYKHNTTLPVPLFQGSDEGEEEASQADCSPSICNPVYEAAPEPAEPGTPQGPAEDKQEVANGGLSDLLQDS